MNFFLSWSPVECSLATLFDSISNYMYNTRLFFIKFLIRTFNPFVYYYFVESSVSLSLENEALYFLSIGHIGLVPVTLVSFSFLVSRNLLLLNLFTGMMLIATPSVSY